jgi:hypothetical protein
MSDDYHDDLDPCEQDLYRSLAGSGAHSKRTEDRVVKALRREGLILVPQRRWMTYAKAGGMVVALFVAFFLGTQVGGGGGERTEQIEPVIQPVPETVSPTEPAPVPAPLPDEQMLTAFHMNGDFPPAVDTEDPELDPYGLMGKTIEP